MVLEFYLMQYVDDRFFALLPLLNLDMKAFSRPAVGLLKKATYLDTSSANLAEIYSLSYSGPLD